MFQCMNVKSIVGSKIYLETLKKKFQIDFGAVLELYPHIPQICQNWNKLALWASRHETSHSFLFFPSR